MNNSNQVQLLLKYYRDVAYKLGIKKDAVFQETKIEQKEQETNTQDACYNPDSQASYSLFWFFDLLVRGFIHRNPLVSAFLENKDSALIADEFTKSYASVEDMEHRLIEKSTLNDSQKQAICRALVFKNPISFIQGPPGTGKTHTILNMASCILGRNMTVAVVSSNHAALDNIAAKVNVYNCKYKNDKAKPNINRLVSKYAELGNSGDREKWSKEHPNKHKFCHTVRKFDSDTMIGGWETKIKAEEFLSDYPFVTCTFHSLMKCFADGDTYKYDYVIIDEASQCGILPGIIALNCARNIVLVGDEQQLSPVHDNSLNSELPKFPFTDDSISLYNVCDKNGDGQSILQACLDVFYKGNNVPKTLLDEHYRCHPGIIEFCNLNIYNNKLKIMTKKEDKNYEEVIDIPIKVLWYEGDYCEGYRMKQKKAAGKNADDKESKPSKRNMKQITIFMEEEWPYLREKFIDKPNYSVCILSPFRGQLESLEERINSAGKEILVELTDISGESLQEKQKRYRENNDIEVSEITNPAMLTIHKAQGQEFDLVYLLPAEDGDWQWPWSQGKKLINVAVSRAKKELRIVVSSCLMDEKTQCKLTKRKAIPPRRKQEMLNMLKKLEQKNDEESKQEIKNIEKQIAQEMERQLFIQKLVEYVRKENEKQQNEEVIGYPISNYKYGFHETKLKSIFDNIPHFQNRESSKAYYSKSWAPEECLEIALRTIDLSKIAVDFQRDVPLLALFNNNSALYEKLQDGEEDGLVISIDDKERFINAKSNERESHFDFVIFDKETYEILLVIEVDGAFHRFNRNKDKQTKQENRDRIKNSIVKDLSAKILNDISAWDIKQYEDSSFIFLRVPSDGSTYMEINALCHNSNEASENQTNTNVTLDDIIRHQKELKCHSTVYLPKEYTAKNEFRRLYGIRDTLKVWQMRDGMFNTIDDPRANQFLRKEGFISGSTQHGWFPTDKGNSIGIVKATNDRKDWKPRCMYSQTATEYLFDYLRNRLKIK